MSVNTQNHAAETLMAQQTQNILSDLESELKTGEGSIKIAKSRNVGGVYSDASGGTRCDAYEIH